MLDRAPPDETPRLGLRLDTSHESPAETLHRILSRPPEARIAG
jgi:hypothetical protein